MWIYRQEDDNYFSQLAKCSDGDDVGECVIYFDPDDVPPSPAQGAMFAEALNVHEQTGLTPAQLQARVAELEAALREGTDTLRSLGNMPDYLVHDDAWDKEQVARKIFAYAQLLGS